MSGPIFVLDAHGTPLMPMAPAHARQLLRRAKARRLPHHAFTIIQLAQAVAAPSLRPLLLGVRIHDHTAVLALIAEGAHVVFPLLRIVVDLLCDPARHVWSCSMSGSPVGLRLRKHRAETSLSAQAGRARHSTNQCVRRLAQTIVQVLDSLRALVPISHLVLFTPPPLMPVVSDGLFQRLYTHPACAGLIVVDGFAVEQITATHATVLQQALGASTELLVSLPVVAACSRSRFNRPLPSWAQSRSRLLGSLARVLYGEHSVIGIIIGVRPAGVVVLRIPHLVGANGIIWHRIRVQRRQMCILSTDHVIFLLVSPSISL